MCEKVIRKDSVTPIINVAVTGKTSDTNTTYNWTNKPVEFALSNNSLNTSPVTYFVNIAGTEYELTDGLVIDIPSEGNPPATATWNAGTKTLVVYGDIYDNKEFSFYAKSAAQLQSASSKNYFVSIQQSKNHLIGNNALIIGDIESSEQPLGQNVEGTDGSPWHNKWFNESNAYPSVLLKDQPKYFHPIGAPVSIEYKLLNNDTKKTTTGKQTITSQTTSSQYI